MSRKERESRTPAQVAEQPVVEQEQQETVLDLLCKGEIAHAVRLCEQLAGRFSRLAPNEVPGTNLCPLMPQGEELVNFLKVWQERYSSADVLLQERMQRLAQFVSGQTGIPMRQLPGTPENPDSVRIVAAPDPMPSPFLLPDALNRVRALLWRAAIELGQGHPARVHIEGLAGGAETILGNLRPTSLQGITATLRLMHASESVLRPLDEAADILAGRR